MVNQLPEYICGILFFSIMPAIIAYWLELSVPAFESNNGRHTKQTIHMDKKVRVQKYLGSVDLAHTQCMHVVVAASG